ncbi:DUF4249 family protein, partial [bacterium]|nr:DUF4249 family protein [bacterium]
MQKISFLIFLSVVIFACGEPTVEIGENNYSPKIVVEGYLFPNRQVENIRISRNIPLNSNAAIKRDSLIIKNATVKINGVQLNFNENKKSYEADETALQIFEGETYKLEVTAKIDGKELSTTSTTKVPQRNGSKFEILSINFDSLFYRERDANGELKSFEITFNPVLNAENGFYALGLAALDADSSNISETFIFDNIFADLDAEDV